jgi:O-antigen ligase
MISTAVIARRMQHRTLDLGASTAVMAIRPVHALLVAPSLLFVIALTLMLFRPPNVGFFPFDRIAFCILAFAFLVPSLILRNRIPCVPALTWPMAVLLALAFTGSLHAALESQTWSLFAAKFLVPFSMFHMATLVFQDEAAIRKLETLCLCVLLYLCLLSVASLLGVAAATFPPYIADIGLGIHADRARGPFLQAAANGTALNLLGLVALDLFRRRRINCLMAIVLCTLLPLAVFATMTRAVWLSFAFSFLMVSLRVRHLRWAWLWIAIGVALAAMLIANNNSLRAVFEDRFEERSPVEFRAAVYRLSWEMFKEKPLLGWGQNQFSPEIESRISEFRADGYAAHNTFIEITVEHGLLGIALYAWMMIGLLRVGRRLPHVQKEPFVSIWPVFLGVYLVNACFVVMNYQFVNALVFTLAGVLAARSAGDGVLSFAADVYPSRKNAA